MTQANLIIDGRNEGLPSAPTYYRTFPHEQSPLGDLDFPADKITVLTNTSLGTVMDAMIAVGSNSIIVLVCHAFKGGILMPVIQGGNGTAELTSMQTLDLIMEAVDVKTVVIPNMPAKTKQEIDAVIARWKQLFDKVHVTYGSDLDLPKADELYNQFLDHYTQAFGFGSKQLLLDFVAKIKKVRGLSISRLELRACNIGKDKTSMDGVRKFFGAGKLTAPMVGTFFNSVLGAGVIRVGNPPTFAGIQGAAVVSGPKGIDVKGTRVAAEATMVDADSEMRGFFKDSFTPPAPAGPPQPNQTPPAAINYYRLTLKVHETSAYHYRSALFVTGHRQGKRMETDNDILKKFVTGFIMTASTYQSGNFPIAGLWTRDEQPKREPFVLPAEPNYVKLIAAVP